MKEGYIVWNMKNYDLGYEFFGVYRSKAQAEKCLRRVLKAKYGKSNLTEDELLELEEDSESGCQDSHRITYFTNEL